MDTAEASPILVGLPAYNEEETLGSVALRAIAHADAVICVDDGSSDASPRIAAACGAEVISHRANRGYGGALKTLFQTARDRGAAALVVLDSDGQHEPEDIPRIVAPILAGEADIVIGSRFLDGGGGTEMPAYRKLGIKVITAASNLSSNRHVTDTQSGFRAFSARALERLHLEANGMELSLEILEAADEHELVIKEVPIIIRYDVPKGSRYTAVSHGFTVLSYALLTLSQKKPLLVFGLPGAGFLAAGAGMGLRAVNQLNELTNLTVGPGLTAAWVGVLGMSLCFTGVVLQGARSLLRRLLVREFGVT